MDLILICTFNIKKLVSIVENEYSKYLNLTM